jgi:hypothetical protein
VHLDGDTSTVVEDGDGVGVAIDSDLKGIHARVVDLYEEEIEPSAEQLSSKILEAMTNLIIGSVNENLVEDLEETRDEGNIPERRKETEISTCSIWSHRGKGRSS